MTIRTYLFIAILVAGGGGLLVSAWIDRGYEMAAVAMAAGSRESDLEHLLREALAVVVYILVLLATLRWLLQRIATPVRQITIAAEDAIEFGRRLEGDDAAPTEIKRLRRTLARLAGGLEDQVEARTRELRETAEALRAEIEERRRTEVRLDEALRTAEGAARAKGEFLSVISHELRTPMHAVLGTMSLLEDSPLDGAQRRLLVSAQAAGSALLLLLNDLLDMSRIEAGRLEIETSELSPTEVVDMVAEVFHTAARDKGVLVAASVAPGVPAVVHGDSLRIRQVLLNLVGNAVKFTERGSVRLAVSLAGDPGDPQMLRFAVTDTGPGIEQADQRKLFTEFSQLDSSYARRHGGTGLGLAISKRLVELMGGSIGLASTPGSGSEFHFTVPCLRPPGDDDAGLWSEALSGRRIMVASDEPAWAEAVALHLEPWTGGVLLAGEDSPTGEPEAADTLIYVSMKPLQQAALDCKVFQNGRGERLESVVLLYPPAGAEPEPAEAHPFDLVLIGPLKSRNLLYSLAREGCPDVSVTDARPEVRGGSGAVLLVEDSEANRVIAETMLARAGYTVTTASDGTAGLEAASKGGFDLVLMDLQMPVMDGFAAARRIRELPGSRGRVPVVALTANVLTRPSHRLASAGFDGFLSKPISRERLLDAVAEWVVVGRLRREEVAEAGKDSRRLTSSQQTSPGGRGAGNE